MLQVAQVFEIPAYDLCSRVGSSRHLSRFGCRERSPIAVTALKAAAKRWERVK
jgi:hypothetical protein